MALFITLLPPGRNSSHCFQQLAPHHTCSFCSWTTPEPENGQWVIAQVRVDHWQKDHPTKWEESTIKTWTDWTIVFFYWSMYSPPSGGTLQVKAWWRYVSWNRFKVPQRHRPSPTLHTFYFLILLNIILSRLSSLQWSIHQPTLQSILAY